MTQALTCFLGIFAAPMAILSSEQFGLVERYGIAGVLGVVAYVCFKFWQQSNGQLVKAQNALIKAHSDRIQVLEREISKRDDLLLKRIEEIERRLVS